VVGAMAGAYGGKAVAEAIDPAAEETYWRERFQSEPYVKQERTYEDYQPAYRTGYEGFSKYEPGTRFEEAEATLKEDYTSTGQASVPWEEARPAAEAAWQRVERGEAVRVPLTEEQLEVSKRQVESGGVRVRKVVKTETVNQPVELSHEEIVVERTDVSGEGTVPAEAFKEGEVYMPLKKEEAVVEISAHLAGEVNVRKVEKSNVEQVQGQIRKEDVEVEEENRGKRPSKES
ncbi:MAG: YsnF/AvaK domain-containing protein, partial [Verrucomicrobiota bacterium]